MRFHSWKVRELVWFVVLDWKLNDHENWYFECRDVGSTVRWVILSNQSPCILHSASAKQSDQIHKIFTIWYAILKIAIFSHFCCPICRFFLKRPDIIFSVMQKPFKKCVFPMRVNRFLHIRRRFQKKRQQSSIFSMFSSWSTRSTLRVDCITFHNFPMFFGRSLWEKLWKGGWNLTQGP